MPSAAKRAKTEGPTLDRESRSSGDDSDAEADEMAMQKAMLQAKFKLQSGSEPLTSTSRRLSATNQSHRLEDRSNHFEAVKRQLKMEEELNQRSYRDIYDEMERDIAESDANDDVDDVPSFVGDDTSDDDGDEEEVAEDDPQRKQLVDSATTKERRFFVPYMRTLGVGTSTGARLWNHASPILYSRLQHLLFHFSCRALRLRRDLKPVSAVPAMRSTDCGAIEQAACESPLLTPQHALPSDTAHCPPAESTSSTTDGGTKVVGNDSMAANDGIASTNLTRIDERLDEASDDSDWETSESDDEGDEESEEGEESVADEESEQLREEDEEDEEEISDEDDARNSDNDEATSEHVGARTENEEDARCDESAEGSQVITRSHDDDMSGSSHERTEFKVEDAAAADSMMSAETYRSPAWEQGPMLPQEDEVAYPAIQRLFNTLRKQIDVTFELWDARKMGVVMDAEYWPHWAADRRREITKCLKNIEALFVGSENMKLSELSRRVYRMLEALGFPDQSPGTGVHDLAMERGSEPQCYSYHPRLFPSMTTLNANLNAFGLLAVLNLEQSDRRLGRPTLVPVPHPHPDVNTEVILCEPKKKKSTIDDFRTLPHPKKAGIHGVEDFLVEEELQYRQCIQLKDHLNRHGSLRGLAAHLYPLVYALVDYDVEEFAKLQSSKRGFLVGVPAGLMRRITEGLKRKLQNLEASREAVRLSVGKIGFYCQGVMWRDQMISALGNYGKNISQFHSIHELSLTQAPVLVPNAWALPDAAEWLTEALGLFLPHADDAGSTVYNVLTQVLRGAWKTDEPHIHSANGCNRYWDPAWGEAGPTVTYIVPFYLVLSIQALLAVTDLLMTAKSNTVKDPLVFLKEFSECRWDSDEAAAAFLVAQERTCNLETARLVGMGCAIDNLRNRCAVLDKERSVAFAEQFIDVQRELPAYSAGSSAPLYWLIDHDRTAAMTSLARLVVSHSTVSDFIPPTLAILDVSRASTAEVSNFFGGFQYDDEKDDNDVCAPA